MALVVAFLMCASMLWHVSLVILLLFLWRKTVQRLIGKYLTSGYYVLWGILWTGFVISLPRYVPLPTDRVRLCYNEDGRIVTPPLSHWLLNVIYQRRSYVILQSG